MATAPEAFKVGIRNQRVKMRKNNRMVEESREYKLVYNSRKYPKPLLVIIITCVSFAPFGRLSLPQ